MKCPTPDCLFTSTLFLTPMLGFEDPHKSADIDFLCSAGMLLTNTQIMGWRECSLISGELFLLTLRQLIRDHRGSPVFALQPCLLLGELLKYKPEHF